MELTPLPLEQCEQWAALLALAFDRPPTQMEQLLERLEPGRRLLAWGAWESGQLAAQYSCLLTELCVPGVAEPVRVGMSINMAVHPAFRGRGLVKRVAEPGYAAVAERGGVAGVGFSNAAGVKVDRRSSGYGYSVVGKMQPSLALLLRRPQAPPLPLAGRLPDLRFALPTPDNLVCFAPTEARLRQRYGLRRYRFGLWEEAGRLRGLVVWRPMRVGPLRGAALLAAYGDRKATLVARWAQSQWEGGRRFVQLVSSPASPLLAALQGVARCVTQPASRSSFYLTVRPLGVATPSGLFNFHGWDCMGGDIL